MFGGDQVPARRGPPHQGALAAGTGGEQGRRNQLGCYQSSRPAPRKRNGPSQSCTQNILPPSAASGAAVGLQGLGSPGPASPMLGCLWPSQAPWELLGRADDIVTSLAWDPHHKETSGALSGSPPILGVLQRATELQCTHPVPTLSSGLPPDRLIHTNIPACVQCPSADHPRQLQPPLHTFAAHPQCHHPCVGTSPSKARGSQHPPSAWCCPRPRPRCTYCPGSCQGRGPHAPGRSHGTPS